MIKAGLFKSTCRGENATRDHESQGCYFLDPPGESRSWIENNLYKRIKIHVSRVSVSNMSERIVIVSDSRPVGSKPYQLPSRYVAPLASLVLHLDYRPPRYTALLLEHFVVK